MKLADAVSIVLAIALTTFALIDLANFGVTGFERVSYVVLVAVMVLGFSLVLLELSAPRYVWFAVAIWLTVVTALLVPTIQQRDLYIEYVAADALSLALPLFFFVVLRASTTRGGLSSISLLGYGLLPAALLAPVLGAGGARFEPPPTLLLAIVWAMFLVAPRASRRNLMLGIAVGLLVLTLESGHRTSVIIWAAMAAYAIWCRLKSTHWRNTIVVSIVAAGVAAAALVPASVSGRLSSEYRIASIARVSADESLVIRLREAADVARTVAAEGGPVNWIFGFGHGATYRTDDSYIARNVTAEGRVHHVHIGPLMILLRYGLIGLLAYTYLWAHVARSLIRAAARPGDGHGGRVFELALAGYLIESLLFNVLIDPLFSYSLAGYLLHRVLTTANARVELPAPGMRIEHRSP